jgi:hypothetical protein
MRTFKPLKTSRADTHWATTAAVWWNAEKLYSLKIDEFVLVTPETLFQLYTNQTTPSLSRIESLLRWLELKLDPFTAKFNDPDYISPTYLSRKLQEKGELWVNTIKIINGRKVYVPVILLQVITVHATTNVVFLNPLTGLKETRSFALLAEQIAEFQNTHPYKAYAWGNTSSNTTAPLRGQAYIDWWNTYKPTAAQKMIVAGAETTISPPILNWKNNAVPYFNGLQNMFTRPRTIVDLSLRYGNGFFVANKTLLRPASMVHDLLLHETASWDFLNLPTAAGPYYPHFCVQPDNNVVQYFDIHEHHHHVEAIATTSVGIDCSSSPWRYHSDSQFKARPMYYNKTGTIADLQALIARNYNFSNAATYDYIFAPPMAQLEALSLLVQKLMTLLNIPAQVSSWASYKSLGQLVDLAKSSGSYNDLTDAAIVLKITGKAEDIQKKFFIIRRTPEYFVFDKVTPNLRKSVKPAIYSHGFLPLSANTGNHSDGHIQGVYTWLRLAKGYTKETAYAKLQELYNTKRYDLTLKGHISLYALDVTTI